MLFSYNWLNDYLTYKISPQELGELLTMHAFEVESVMKKGDDWALDIDVLSNRATDCFSHTGVARESNALLGFLGRYEKKKAKPFYDEKEIKAFFVSLASARGLSVTVERREDCPLYHLLLIRDVVVRESPLWMKKRLEVVGLNSINNLVDSSNYVMLDTGEPLHMFDADEVAEKNKRREIMVRRAKEGEKLTLLGGEGVSLSANDLVIADTQKVLALAGIKGGEETGVKKKTGSILIEAANFNRSLLYKTSKRLNISSDSAKRWSAGVPRDVSWVGLFKAIKLIQSISKGEGASYASSVSPSQVKMFSRHAPIFINQKKVNALIGEELSEEKIRRLLFQLGFEVQKESEGIMKVHPPFWRLDCEIEEDVIEEIARFVGLDDIHSVPPTISLVEPVNNGMLKWRSFIRTFFTGHGFDEVYSYSLQNSQSKIHNPQLAELRNPISENRKHLRGSLIPGLLETVAMNQHHYTSMKVFEIGNVFLKQASTIHEREVVSGAVYDKKGSDIFRETRGYIEGLFEALGFDEEDYDLVPSRLSNEKLRGLEVHINETPLGHIMIPAVPEGMKIKGNVATFELDVSLLIRKVDEEREFSPPPKYPAVERDISLFVSKGIKAGSVIQAIHEVGKELIEDVDVFDIYEEAEKSMKGLAFHIIYRSSQKTLRDEEVNKVHKYIEKTLTKRFHAQVR